MGGRNQTRDRRVGILHSDRDTDSVSSGHCRVEFQSFLNREAAIGRSNLIFPILYVRVPALEREADWRKDEVLKIIGSRQYIDWQRLRHRNFSDTDVAEKIEQYSRNIVEALRQPWLSPEVRRRNEEAERQRIASAEAERQEAVRRRQEAGLAAAAEANQARERQEAIAAAGAEAEPARRREIAQANTRELTDSDRSDKGEAQSPPANVSAVQQSPLLWLAQAPRPVLAAGIALVVAIVIAGVYFLTPSTVPPASTPAPPSVTQVPPPATPEFAGALRLDGTYTGAISGGVPEFFRFYSDGAVIYNRVGAWTPTESSFTRESGQYHAGHYQESGNRITFSMTDQYGTMDYQGTITPDQLTLNWFSHINQNRGTEILKFRPW